MFVLFEKYALILKCKHLEFLMQLLNVDGIKFGDTKLILPIAKFSSTPIVLLRIWYAIHVCIMSGRLLHFKLCCCVFMGEGYSCQLS